MSPIIFPVLLREPSQDSGLFGGGGGMICAIGSPFRVTRIGRPVRLTLASSARQVALNFEIDTSSSTATSYHRSEEHTSELQSRLHLVCRLLLEKKKNSDSARANQTRDALRPVCAT